VCKAFSCVVLKSGDVAWEFGKDSHEDLIAKAKLSDRTVDPKEMEFCRVEIEPNNGSYLAPDEWSFRIDQEKPAWWSSVHEGEAWKAQKVWLKKLNKILIHKPIIHPFRDIVPPKKITKRHLALLKSWDSVGASVWDSVRASVRDSVWDSVGASVGDSVWDSVWDSVGVSVGASVRVSVGASVWASVRASVWASVWAYIGSFFNLPRDDWKYTEKIKAKGYPFQPAVDLWEMGLVPSFDGNTWRLHGGKDSKVLWKGKP
jgi:hypothetical protein